MIPRRRWYDEVMPSWIWIVFGIAGILLGVNFAIQAKRAKDKRATDERIRRSRRR